MTRFPQRSLFSKIHGDHGGCQSKGAESGCSVSCLRLWGPLCILPWEEEEGRSPEPASLALCPHHEKVIAGKFILLFGL